MSGRKKRIVVTTTAYDGEREFPEAESYPEYAEGQLARLYDAEVSVTVGRHATVAAYGFQDDMDVTHEILDLVRVGLWDDFVAGGYKAYSTVADFEGRAPCRS